MDANEIDLDDLDKSDISSDWDSSVDEAPVMEVFESRGEQEVQEERMIAEEQLREMQSDEEPDSIPRSFWRFCVKIIGTKHEIGQEELKVDEITEVLDSSAVLIHAGYVSHVLEGSYVIDAGINAKYLLFGTCQF